MTFERPTRAGLAIAALGLLCVAGFAGVAFAEDAAPAAAAAPAIVPNKGDTAWMLVSSALVLMMSIPGLALFYGGLGCGCRSRRRRRCIFGHRQAGVAEHTKPCENREGSQSRAVGTLKRHFLYS